MVCEKLARTLRIQITQRRAPLRLDSQPSHHALDDSVSNQEVPNKLNSSRIRIPVFGNDARQTCWRDKENKPARRCIRINHHIDAGWNHVESAGVAPAFADATAQDLAKVMRAGDVQRHHVIGERRLQVLRRVNPL